MKNTVKIFSSIILGLVVVFFPTSSYAAKLFAVPPSTILEIGEKVSLDIKIDGEGSSFNGAQVTVRFPKDILEVVSINKDTSAFNFWLEDPVFSNEDGTVSFMGGTPYGVSGSSVQALRIVFVAKSIGNAEIILDETTVTASDGSGTNILSKVNNALIAVATTKTVPQVQQINREPVPGEGLPVKPVVSIPLYPEEDKWYNVESAFNAKWDLPLDISGVSTAVNKTPSFTPAEKSEGLFDNKIFNAVSDGNWYLHVRFKNNIGWGPVTHKKISIDTRPPIGFDISVLEGEETDNPAPTLQFKTKDALSGLKEYGIRIDSGELIRIPENEIVDSYKMPLQSPGSHQVVVRAIDQADNGVENRITVNIKAIDSPSIVYVTKELFSDEEKGLTIKGAALPNIEVLLSLYRSEALVKKETARTDEKGNFEFIFSEPLKNGKYIIRAQSKDGRGALSLEVDSPTILVKNRPIIQLGGLQVGAGGALVFLVILVAIGFGSGFWFYKKREEKIGLRVSIAKIDFEKMLKIINEDIGRLEQARKTPGEADDKFLLGKLEDNMKKLETYLKKEIEKIKE